MAYPMDLTSVLTGATPSQLRRWRGTGLVVPEVKRFRPPLYSFRDLLLLRSVVFLRAQTSSQKIHKAFSNLPDVIDVMDHPSRYRFGVDEDTIYLGTEDGEAVDLLKRVGNVTVFSFQDMLNAFPNFKDTPVPDLGHPSEHVEVRPQRMGGWPTIEGTRVPYDTIARLVDYQTVFPDDVQEFYPSVSADAANDAVAFAARVEAVPA